MQEDEVRRHTKSVLEGLLFVHGKWFVHCNVKPEKVLIFDNSVTKIADFRLAKKAREMQSKVEVRGTPLYMVLESVNDNMYEACSDVWFLECLVAEMASRKLVWDHKPGANMFKVLLRIGGDEMPQIPEDLSE